MTLSQFKALSRDKHYHLLITWGACIGERISDNTVVLLFQLGNYYVEVFFTANGEEVISSRTFSEVDELKPYLSNIDIIGLLE